MPKKKPMKTEARPKKKKDQRTVISKNATSKSAVSKSAASKGTVSRGAPKAAASVTSRGNVAKATPSRSPAELKSRTNSEKGPKLEKGKLEKSLKPLAKVKAAPAAPPAAATSLAGKGPQKPSKPARRIPNAELNKIRTLLSQKKIALTNHLQSELSELEKPEKRHRSDLEEIASDTHDTDSLCEIMDIETSQIGQIDMALKKIDNGTYGICEDCGGEIPLIRLEALPFATQCIECKRKAEIEGRISAER